MTQVSDPVPSWPLVTPILGLNIPSNTMAIFLHDHQPNNDQRKMNPFRMTIINAVKKLSELGLKPVTCTVLSPVCYVTKS